MNRFLPLVALFTLLLGLLSGCVRHYYGVPEDDWRRMSKQERSEIILIYQERRMHEERRRATEAEVRAREMARHRHYPEWIHVHLSGGVFIYRGKRYRYHAHNLRLRRDEVRIIDLVSTNTRKPHRVKLWVRYHEGKVKLGDGKHYLRSFDYQEGWRDAEHYKGVRLRGGFELEGVKLVIGSKPHKRRSGADHDGEPRPGKGNSSNRDAPATGPQNGKQKESDQHRGGGWLELKQQQQRAIEEAALARKEQVRKEQARKEQARKEQARKEQARKEQARKEQARKEQARKEQARKEQAEKEEGQQKDSAEDKEKGNGKGGDKRSSPECIERGKGVRRHKKDLSYCEE